MKIFIEIAKGTNTKYEYDEVNKCLVLDRILHNTNRFPYNYGFVPNTLSPDGDPLDIIVLCDSPLLPGTMVDVKIIGGIDTNDEKGQDDKLISVLNDNIDITSKYLNDINDISKYDLNNIHYFLSHYKDGEENKYNKVGDFYDKKTAQDIIKKYTVLEV